MSPVPCEPTPIAPITIRPLGAPAPKTDEGTIVGRAIVVPAAATVPLKKLLRVIKPSFFIVLSCLRFAETPDKDTTQPEVRPHCVIVSRFIFFAIPHPF
jgi:hypothetical protein